MPYSYQVLLADIEGELHQAQPYSSDEPVAAGETIQLPDGLLARVALVEQGEGDESGRIIGDLPSGTA